MITQPVDRFQLVISQQFVRYRDPIDLFIALVDLRHAHENAAVLFEREILVCEQARDVDEPRVVEKDRPQDESFGVYVGGETFLRD